MRVICNEQSNAQYIKLTEYNPLLHPYIGISNTMDILTFQFAMEHVKNSYNMFYLALVSFSNFHKYKCLNVLWTFSFWQMLSCILYWIYLRLFFART